MSNQMWIGVDMAKDSFHAAVAAAQAQPAEWATFPHAEFEHTRKGVRSFLAWAKRHGGAPETVAGVCLEATGRYSDQWADLVGERLGPIAIVNPARPLAYAKSLGIRDKSDRVDACVLALFGQATQPRPRSRPTQAQRHLRELSRTYQTISAEWQAHQQRLQSGLTSPAARTCLRTIMRAVAKQKGALEDEMKRLIAQDPVLKHDYKRAQTVKGIGPKTATVILAEFGDLRQYNRDELVALAGLYPREKTSGRSLRKKARLIKAGKAGVRAMLYMGAMNAVKYDPWLRAFARRLEAHGKQPMQILVAVMRKLLMIVRAVVIAEQDYDPNYQHASYCPAA